MNVGGDSGHDDEGLPPDYAEIPDDARALDRDVLAYHRELRAQRRRRIMRRLRAPLTRDGMILPLLAGCLALTLLVGTLLTVFTASQGSFGAGPVTGGSSSGTAGRVGGPLPNANVLVGGQATPLRSLAAAVLALVSPTCRCNAALGRLTREAEAAGARVYVVGIYGAQVTALTRQLGLRASQAVEDPANVLASFYHPAGLTAILIRADGTVSAVVAVQRQTTQLEQDLRALPGTSGGPEGLGGAATPVEGRMILTPARLVASVHDSGRHGPARGTRTGRCTLSGVPVLRV